MHLVVHHIIKISINKWKSEKLIPMIDINQQLNILLESFTSKLVSKSTLFKEKRSRKERACWIKKNEAEIKKRIEKHTRGCELRMNRCRDQELQIDARSRTAS
jgi:hypothetical protein